MSLAKGVCLSVNIEKLSMIKTELQQCRMLSGQVWIMLGGLPVIALLAWQWQGIMAMTVSEELATIDGYPVKRLSLMLVL